MASTYPGAVDTFTDPASTDRMDVVGHAAMHTLVHSALTAVETTLGVSPQGGSTSISVRLADIEFRTIMGVY